MGQGGSGVRLEAGGRSENPSGGDAETWYSRKGNRNGDILVDRGGTRVVMW